MRAFTCSAAEANTEENRHGQALYLFPVQLGQTFGMGRERNGEFELQFTACGDVFPGLIGGLGIASKARPTGEFPEEKQIMN